MMAKIITTQHTFELSGLGIAPFELVILTEPLVSKAAVFWCEHCGTQIKNRYFVRSSDNIVSVVGIDCANKTGDQGIIDGIKRQKRLILAEKREAERKEILDKKAVEERAKYDGHTIAELKEIAQNSIDELGREFAKNLETDHPIISEMENNPFLKSMQLQAYCGQSLSRGQLSVTCEILAKKRSGSRKKSKVYNEAHERVSTEVENLNEALLRHEANVEKIRLEAAALRM